MKILSFFSPTISFTMLKNKFYSVLCFTGSNSLLNRRFHSKSFEPHSLFGHNFSLFVTNESGKVLFTLHWNALIDFTRYYSPAFNSRLKKWHTWDTMARLIPECPKAMTAAATSGSAFQMCFQMCWVFTQNNLVTDVFIQASGETL